MITTKEVTAEENGIQTLWEEEEITKKTLQNRYINWKTLPSIRYQLGNCRVLDINWKTLQSIRYKG